MGKTYDDGWVQIIQGNALEVLGALEPESMQCVVTSPPYWGLRKYAGEQEMVWGNADCEHEWGKQEFCPISFCYSDFWQCERFEALG